MVRVNPGLRKGTSLERIPPCLKSSHRPRRAKALVLGIANEYSIAYGCAHAFRKLGAELAITYLNEKTKPTSSPWQRVRRTDFRAA